MTDQDYKSIPLPQPEDLFKGTEVARPIIPLDDVAKALHHAARAGSELVFEPSWYARVQWDIEHAQPLPQDD